MRMRRMNTEFGKQSLMSGDPVVWYGLNNSARNQVNQDLLNSALKKIKEIYQISFQKGTCIKQVHAITNGYLVDP